MVRNRWSMIGRCVLAVSAGATLHGQAPAANAPQSRPTDSTATAAANANDGRRDFDFFFGRWKVRNRRLVARLQGSTEWQEFEATSEARALPTGLANEDVFRSEHQPGFVGMTFRFFDPQSRTWAIYWVDNRIGVLEPPVIGAFKGDVGIFKGPDVFRGRPITVRFTWSGATTGKPRWEQAFSPDGGQSWETNWVMEFTRIEDPR